MKNFACLTTGALIMLAAPASAQVTVSDFGGNLDAFSFSVSGNTITIDETWGSTDPVFLMFEGLDAGVNYTVVKNITNATGVDWTSLANELLDPIGDPNDDLDPSPLPGFVPGGFSTSNDFDGLSFAQGSGIPRTSSVFGTVFADELTDARDFLDYINGPALAGSMFDISFGLRDNSGENQPFLLSQRANVRSVQAVPEPSTWAMMLLGFFGLGGILRRRAPARLAASHS